MWIADWTWRQGVCPAAAIEREGFGVAKLKCGGAIKDGWTFIDPTFRESSKQVRTTGLIPMAYWFLMPGRGKAQAALFVEELELAYGSLDKVVAEIDIEFSGDAATAQAGLTWQTVNEFMTAWYQLTGGKAIFVYTRKNFWEGMKPNPNDTRWFPFALLEEAHWVPPAVREDPKKPFASQQYKAVNSEWWNTNYWVWPRATILQFTNSASVAGKVTCASFYPGSAEVFADLYLDLAM
jgi:hypothetical protein